MSLADTFLARPSPASGPALQPNFGGTEGHTRCSFPSPPLQGHHAALTESTQHCRESAQLSSPLAQQCLICVASVWGWVL